MGDGVIRVAHYINQFFAGVGGEDVADHAFEVREGAVGPGRALEMGFGSDAEVVTTLVCGDNRFHDETEVVIEAILEELTERPVDVLVAGPSFNAGRYGLASATVCAAVIESLEIPAVTGLFPDNPAVEIFRDRIVIVPTRDSAAGMLQDAKAMAAVAVRVARGEELGPAAEAGVVGRGIRANSTSDVAPAKRGVDMLLAKLRGDDFVTEVPLPVAREEVSPAPAVLDLSRARVALITEGGLVPLGNPDRIESSKASKWAAYPVAALEGDSGAGFASIHAGFDTRWVDADPNRHSAGRCCPRAGINGSDRRVARAVLCNSGHRHGRDDRRAHWHRDRQSAHR